MENYTKLKELVASIEADAQKFYNNGNSAAGTRVRKGLQEIKTLAQEIRNEITAIKKCSKKISLFI
ncbi:histone H1 [Sphingobacterium sp. T2]|uniref:histone H1 n=1 Tax=Sphingobacterium sp. T2 TaxID=1590596 RepID=UPI00057B926C|nr:histone H1 [Sphingobacterium sp. T2]